MFFKLYSNMFITAMVLGTLISISSANWFTAWLGLEINLLSVTPLILSKMAPSLSEASIKYFLAQAFASLILIVASTFSLLTFNLYAIDWTNLILTVAISIKMGMIPFHFWFPQVIKLMNWTQALIMMTWQKVAPLILASFLETKLFMIMIILSSFIGSVLGLSQNNLKLILTYSSISHSGWMISSSLLDFNILAIYFSAYCLISASIILTLKKFNILKIKQISQKMNNKFYKITFSLNMFSLGGLPPLLGFLVKLLVFFVLTELTLYLLSATLVASSLLSLFFYTRIIYISMMIKNTYFLFVKKSNYKLDILLTLSIIANLCMPFMV